MRVRPVQMARWMPWLASIAATASAVEIGSGHERRAEVWLCVAIGLVVLAGLVWRRERRLSRIVVEPGGLRFGDRVVPWAELTATGRSGNVEVGANDGPRFRVRHDRVANHHDVAGAIRARIVPARWQVAEREVPRRGWTRTAARRVSEEREPTYRVGPALVRPPEWLRRPITVWPTVVPAALLILLLLAARSTLQGAWPLVPRLTAFGALALIAILVVATPLRWRASRVARTVHRWLGTDARGDGRAHAISADGRRRVRVEALDAHSLVGAHMALEELDLRGGVTRARVTGLAFRATATPSIRHRWVASLSEAIDSGRCATIVHGPDGSIDDARALAAAKVLVLDERDDGVLLTRFTDTREWAGSTWHATRSEAERQIEDEYGARDLTWREAPLDGGAISFFAYA